MNRFTLSLGVVGLLAACSSADHAMKSSGEMYAEDSDSAPNEPSASGGDVSNESEDTDHDDGFGSEQEESLLALMPATTNVFVFVANPDRNTVTRIDVETLQVLTAEVGIEPTLVETASDYSRAVTFDKGSNTVSIIDADSMDVLAVDIRSNLNQMKMSPDGKWVICYHDINHADSDSSAGGAVTFNAISIVDLENGEAYDAIVGAHPHDVQFTDDSGVAVVISDDYISSISLDVSSLHPRRIAIAQDLVNPPKAEEVLLDPLGRYALVRQYGVDELVLVDFDENAEEPVSYLEVGSNPTDMDVSAEGTEAIVVARGSNEIWIYDLDDPTQTPNVVPMPESETFGSLILSGDDGQGVLYSTQTGDSRMGVWDRDADEILVRGTVKPISSVGISPTGETAIVFHPKDNGNIDPSSPYFNKNALSLMDMSDFFSTSYQLAAEPKAFSSTPDGNIGFYIMEDQPYLEILDYRTFVPSEIHLPSTPVHLGALPDTNTAFISQEHNLGRISFFNADEDALETITGFELNAAIEHD